MSYFRSDWDEIDKKKFPETLKKYRLNQGYTQAKLAEKIGVLNTTISNYEKGVSLPDMKTLVKIARILRVDPGEFCVDWRPKSFYSSDSFEDVVPVIVQVEKDFLSNELTQWFATLPATYDKYGCRATLVPKKYLRDDEQVHFVIVDTVCDYNDGDAVVCKNDQEMFFGIYSHLESGEALLKPIKYWNPENNMGLLLERVAPVKFVGKIISYISQELTT